jgi:mono/diheme cytochrome c family protein
MKRSGISTFIVPAFAISMAIFGFRFINTTPSEKWVAPPAADNIKNPLSTTEENILAGKKIFEGICWTCHGMNGNGNGPAALTLEPKPANFLHSDVQSQTDGAIFWKISIGRGAMVPFSQSLTTEQRWQLVCFIRTFQMSKDKSSLH